jgi:hypothetical protein
MSKCQIQKYKPGGRCGGDSQECKKDGGNISKELSALLAARSKQDSFFNGGVTAAAPAPSQQRQQKDNQTQITIHQPTKNMSSNDIDIVLAGDY